jgi:hypothetical protein
MSITADQPSAPPAGLYEQPVLVIDPVMHAAPIWRADADAAARWAVTGSDDKTVRVWSLTDGALLDRGGWLDAMDRRRSARADLSV